MGPGDHPHWREHRSVEVRQSSRGKSVKTENWAKDKSLQSVYVRGRGRRRAKGRQPGWEEANIPVSALCSENSSFQKLWEIPVRGVSGEGEENLACKELLSGEQG